MAYNEKLAARVREALAHLAETEEKKMFSGVTFMVNNKMCINVIENKIMCRIDPKLHEELIKKEGCHTMEMKGRKYKGYVLVNEEGTKTKKNFDFWIGLSLAFNKHAKASLKKKK